MARDGCSKQIRKVSTIPGVTKKLKFCLPQRCLKGLHSQHWAACPMLGIEILPSPCKGLIYANMPILFIKLLIGIMHKRRMNINANIDWVNKIMMPLQGDPTRPSRASGYTPDAREMPPFQGCPFRANSHNSQFALPWHTAQF